MSKQLEPTSRPLTGKLKVPGDKSISHRAIMLAAVAEGETTVSGFLPGEDCLRTIECFEKLGVKIVKQGDRVTVSGKGWSGLKEPSAILDVGNSGTTIRLLLGILAGQSFHSVLLGDESIGKRPMDRVTKPLRSMGALIDGRRNGSLTPLSIRGGQLKGVTYHSPVASAQVKSAILLAGLQANGVTMVSEPYLSRDHTERMLSAFGVDIRREETTVSIKGRQPLQATDIQIPADISSAAFFIVAAAITPGSDITLLNVGMNPTRSGIVDVLRAMGASLTIQNKRKYNNEPVADIRVRYSHLKNVEISGEMIPRLIDEIPIISLAATQADGEMVIKDAAELKVKETDRIDATVQQLKLLGGRAKATDDGMIISGKTELKGGKVNSLGDHRIGMMLAVASLIANNHVTLENDEAINISYPNFFADLNKLKKTK